VLENLRAENGVEACVVDRESAEVGDDVSLPRSFVQRCGPVLRYVVAMLKEGPVRGLAGTSVKDLRAARHACREPLYGREYGRALDRRLANEGGELSAGTATGWHGDSY
jgi:hypothetical protein